MAQTKRADFSGFLDAEQVEALLRVLGHNVRLPPFDGFIKVDVQLREVYQLDTSCLTKNLVKQDARYGGFGS